MAKKEEPKVQVLRTWTKSDVESYGLNMVMWNHWKWWLFGFVLSLGIAFLTLALTENKVIQDLAIVPFCGVFISLFVIGFRGGKKFWQEIKDKPQPIDLDPYIKRKG